MGDLHDPELSGPPPLDVGSPVARALHGIWSGIHSTEIIEVDPGRRIAAAAVAAHLALRSDLYVAVTAQWSDERRALAWELVRWMPAWSIVVDSPPLTRSDLPPGAAVPGDGRETGRVWVSSMMPCSSAWNPDQVTVVVADHEHPALTRAAWSMERLVVVAPCSVVPSKPPVRDLILEVPLDVTLAGCVT